MSEATHELTPDWAMDVETRSLADATQVDLPRENVYGHTKKVILLRNALDRLRYERGRGLRILDVGCGNGSAVSQYLATASDQVLGIDVHEPSVEFAQRRFGRNGLAFSACSIQALAASGHTFDAVVFADVLEHVNTPGEFLTTARRLLSPGGRVLVTIPNGQGPYEAEMALSRIPYFGRASIWAVDLIVAVFNKFILPGVWSRVVSDTDIPYNHASGHVQFFTLKHFSSLVSAAGLALVDSHNLSFLSGPYTNYFMAPSRAFCRLNNRIADRLPKRLASAWFFEINARDLGGR